MIAKTAATHTWTHQFASEVYRGLKIKVRNGIPVDLRYLHFLSPGHPLLVQLEKVALGTYRHSIIVGSLAATAAARIGANADLARMLGYYHDTGKLSRPEIYSEAQTGKRARLKEITTLAELHAILGHPRASSELARQFCLPPEICAALAEHHGTIRTRVALSPELAAQVNPSELHYPGPLPSTKESAIVMFADSSGAVFERIMHKKGWPVGPDRAFIREFVDKVGNELRREGQFANSTLRLEEQAQVVDSITWWFFRFYNNLKVFGTPNGEGPVNDGRLILRQPRR